MIIDPIEELRRKTEMLDALGMVANKIKTGEVTQMVVFAGNGPGIMAIESSSEGGPLMYIQVLAWLIQKLGFVRQMAAPSVQLADKVPVGAAS